MGERPGGAPVFCGRGLRSRAEQLGTKRQQSSPAAIGKEAEVSDAHETLGKQVEQKTPQELSCRKCHFAFYVSMGAVSPSECDIAIGKRNQAMVGDGHSMSVAAEIAKNIFRAAKRAFAMDHPVMAEELTDKGVKQLRV